MTDPVKSPPAISTLHDVRKELEGQKEHTQKLMQKAQLMVQAYRSSQPSSATAPPPGPSAAEQTFDRIDTNRDGVIDRKEFAAAFGVTLANPEPAPAPAPAPAPTPAPAPAPIPTAPAAPQAVPSPGPAPTIAHTETTVQSLSSEMAMAEKVKADAVRMLAAARQIGLPAAKQQLIEPRAINPELQGAERKHGFESDTWVTSRATSSPISPPEPADNSDDIEVVSNSMWAAPPTVPPLPIDRMKQSTRQAEYYDRAEQQYLEWQREQEAAAALEERKEADKTSTTATRRRRRRADNAATPRGMARSSKVASKPPAVGYSGIAAAKEAAMRWKQSEQNTVALQEEQSRKQQRDGERQALTRKLGLLQSISKQASDAMRGSVKLSKAIRTKLSKHQEAAHSHLIQLRSTVIQRLERARQDLASRVVHLKELRVAEVNLLAERKRLCDETMPMLRMAADEVAALDFKLQEGESHTAALLTEATSSLEGTCSELSKASQVQEHAQAALMEGESSTGFDVEASQRELAEVCVLLAQNGLMKSPVRAQDQQLVSAREAVLAAARHTESFLAQAAHAAGEVQQSEERAIHAHTDHVHAQTEQQARATHAAELATQLQETERKLSSMRQLQASSSEHMHNLEHARQTLELELLTRTEQHTAMVSEFAASAEGERTRRDHARRALQSSAEHLSHVVDRVAQLKQAHEDANRPVQHELVEMQVQHSVLEEQMKLVAKEKAALDHELKGFKDSESAECVDKIRGVATWLAANSEQCARLADGIQERQWSMERRLQSQRSIEAEHEVALQQAEAQLTAQQQETQRVEEQWAATEQREAQRVAVFEKYQSRMQSKLSQLEQDSTNTGQLQRQEHNEQELRQLIERLHPAVLQAEQEQINWLQRMQAAADEESRLQGEVLHAKSTADARRSDLERALEAEHRLRMQVEDLESRAANRVWSPTQQKAMRAQLLQRKAQLESGLEQAQRHKVSQSERFALEGELQRAGSQVQHLETLRQEQQRRVEQLRMQQRQETEPVRGQLSWHMNELGAVQTAFEAETGRLDGEISGMQRKMKAVVKHINSQEDEIATLAAALREGVQMFQSQSQPVGPELDKLNKLWWKTQGLAGEVDRLKEELDALLESEEDRTKAEHSTQPLKALTSVEAEVTAALDAVSKSVIVDPESAAMIREIQAELQSLEAEVATNQIEALCDGRDPSNHRTRSPTRLSPSHARSSKSRLKVARHPVAVCTFATAANNLDNEASRQACQQIEFLKQGLLVKKKPTKAVTIRGAELVDRYIVLSTDLTRLQLRDPAKPKVTESFVRVEHVLEVRDGGIGSDLRPASMVLGLLLQKNVTLNLLFDNQAKRQSWLEALNFLLGHKTNLVHLRELVDQTLSNESNQ